MDQTFDPMLDAGPRHDLGDGFHRGAPVMIAVAGLTAAMGKIDHDACRPDGAVNILGRVALP